MTDIRFYHLQRQGLEEALPKLMEKALSTGKRVVVKTPDTGTAQKLDKALWTYDASSFLPHGVEGDKFASHQPLFITTNDENPASAQIQVLINAVDSPDTETYGMCLYMFDGRNEVTVQKAREAWKAFSGGEHTMSYWQQRETGGWEQKA